MLILKLILLIPVLLYLLYLLFPAAILTGKILNALFIITWSIDTKISGYISPKGKQNNGIEIAPFSEILKELPEYLNESIKEAFIFGILPFLIVKALLSKEIAEEAG